jgi:hypothetical protein
LEADVSAIVIRDADVFVGTSVGTPGAGVFRSTDHGTSWTAVNQGLPEASWGDGDTSGYAHIRCFVSNGQVLFAGTYGNGVYSTTNDGASWNAASTGLTSYCVNALTISGDCVLAATIGGVFRSTNNGTSWSEANAGLAWYSWPPYICSFAVIGTSVFAGGSIADVNGVTQHGVFLSTDSGRSWTEVGMGFGSPVVSLAAVGSNLLVGTMYDGAFLSTNNSLNWRSISSGGDGPIVANDTYAFWGTNGWMWPGGGGLRRRSLSEIITSADPVASASPCEFVLQQNYPNPFNPSTTIRFELPKSSDVKLGVFGILGREVSVLVNERRDAGVHEVKCDGSKLASGVYFYRLQAGSFIDVKKFILLK